MMASLLDWLSLLTPNPNYPAVAPDIAHSAPAAAALSIAGFLGNLADGKFWASLGWIVLGAALMIIGVVLWVKKSALPGGIPGIP